jgi:predicted alpha/beta-hydrolase family hydrolase
MKSEHLFIGGKSMGGRIASLVADEAKVTGLVCLGYPFHPTGKPNQLRVEHLRSIRTPTLVVQGERDPFGTRQEVSDYKLASRVRVHWLTDANHSFKPRKSSGRTLEENLEEAIDVCRCEGKGRRHLSSKRRQPRLRRQQQASES